MKFIFLVVFLIPLYSLCQDDLDSTLAKDALKVDTGFKKKRITPIVVLQRLIAKPSSIYGYILEKRLSPGKEYSIIKIDSGAGKFWINDPLGNPISIVSFISKDNSINKVQVEDIFWTIADANSIKKKYGIKTWNMILERELVIGWTEELCLLSWGPPQKVNSTVTSNGTHEQWIYHGRNLYLDNGKLTAIQRY